MNCKICGCECETEVCRYCEKLKDDLEMHLEEVAATSDSLGLNVTMSIVDGKATCITWYRDIKGNVVSNDYFNLEV